MFFGKGWPGAGESQLQIDQPFNKDFFPSLINFCVMSVFSSKQLDPTLFDNNKSLYVLKID